MKNITKPQLLNISEAAFYLGTTHEWINFLKDNALLIPLYLPQYKKPRFTRKSLDNFIKRLEAFAKNDMSDDLLQKAFFDASKIREDKYNTLKNVI